VAWLTGFIALALMVGACGPAVSGSTVSGAAGGGPAGPPAHAPTAAPSNLCSLLTDDEAAQALGVPTTHALDNPSTCRWRRADHKGYVVVTYEPTSGDAVQDMVDHPEGVPGGQRVDIGDGAFLSTQAGSVHMQVAGGDLEVIGMNSPSGTTSSDVLPGDIAVKLARLVYSRL